jgi:hypothetical protein
MLKSIPTESGFIWEGEIAEVAPGDANAGAAQGEQARPGDLHPCLLDGLTRLSGQRVRITVEVLRNSPTDRLRALIERFREESEEPPSRNSAAGT